MTLRKKEKEKKEKQLLSYEIYAIRVTNDS